MPPVSVRLASVVIAVCCVALLIPAGFASASPTASQSARHRVGGKVHQAWPRKGRPPHDLLARWLARQVGPTCPKKPKKRHVKCKASAKGKRARRSSAQPTYFSSGQPKGAVAVAAASGSGGSTLELTRSYEIPKDDPSYNRLLNWSWTYDSAITAAGFVASGDKSQAQQLLDQLKALQFTDGSLDIAFDVSTGKGAGLSRAGGVAWFGLAANAFDTQYRSTRYKQTEILTAKYLMSLQGSNNLIRGGSDVSWVSTQHNLLAYAFLVDLYRELGSSGSAYKTAAAAIADGIDSRLFIDDSTGPHFIQGLDDTAQPIDVQAIGAMYLAGRGEDSTAQKLLDRTNTLFTLGGMPITQSSDPATYNMAYSSKLLFTGFRPYYGDKTPSVLWFDGLAMMRQATAALKQSTAGLDANYALWRAVAPSTGPLQANQVSNSAGLEYHVWPEASGAGWWLLAQYDPTFFAAPL